MTTRGLSGFLKVQYTAIAKIAVIAVVVIFVSYKIRPEFMNKGGVNSLGSNVLGIIGCLSFILVGEVQTEVVNFHLIVWFGSGCSLLCNSWIC